MLISRISLIIAVPLGCLLWLVVYYFTGDRVFAGIAAGGTGLVAGVSAARAERLYERAKSNRRF